MHNVYAGIAVRTDATRLAALSRVSGVVAVRPLPTYHVTNAGSCSWYEFARQIFQMAGISGNLSRVTSAEYAAAARRPAYSVLAPEALRAVGLPLLRVWPDALAAYLEERQCAGS